MQAHHTPSQPVWIGLDVSKQQVDFFLLNRKDNPRGCKPRRADVLEQAARQWRAEGVTRAVIEATGGLERKVWAALSAGGLEVSVVQPRRARQFARACGQEAKTDQLDAALLAHFGEALQPPPTPLPSVAQRRYQELLRALDALVDDRAELRTRRHGVCEPAAQAALEAVIAAFTLQIGLLEQAVKAALAALPETHERAERLRQAPGVGPKVAWTLTAEMPELGAVTGKQAAALAGLAPRARDSGASRGRRSIGGGRPRLRRILYLAARAAVRVDRRLRSFYERLQAAGKRKQVGLIAVARRLLVMLNAMVRDGSDWRAAPV